MAFSSFLLILPSLRAAESWAEALNQMPLATNVAQLNRTNCVGLMLGSFQSNPVVKGLVFLPGATDEFYFFRRAKATLTNNAPTLLDAICALTNQTFIRATFRPPLLLLHTDEDLLEPEITIQDPARVEKLKRTLFLPSVMCNDTDWDHLQPVLTRQLGVSLLPPPYSTDSWHFYRHSFAGWNLTDWEALQAIALAGETSITVKSRELLFQGDVRFRPAPKVGAMPK